jgi:TRAP-type C4-dicarboxylate transport system permease small subunit
VKFENTILSLVLVGIVMLPLLEAVLRKTLHVGISHSAAIVQHLTLVVGMMGAAVAARENRLLALSRLGELLTGRWRKLAAALSGAPRWQ